MTGRAQPGGVDSQCHQKFLVAVSPPVPQGEVVFLRPDVAGVPLNLDLALGIFLHPGGDLLQDIF